MGLFNETMGATAFRSALEDQMRTRKGMERKLPKKALTTLESCAKAAVEAALAAYEARAVPLPQ